MRVIKGAMIGDILRFIGVPRAMLLLTVER